MNKTMKKSVVLSSVLSIVLCVSLIVGATFALFTSESKVNVAVTSGKVDVVATVDEGSLTHTSVFGQIAAGTYASLTGDNRVDLKIIPGDEVSFDILIHNNSDIAVQYRTVIEKVTDDGLWDGLEVKFNGVKYEGRNAVKSKWAPMAINSGDITVTVTISLPTDAGDAYQNKGCTLAYTVEAVQGNATVFDEEWDGDSVTAPGEDDEGVIQINTAAEFVDFITNLTNDQPYKGKTAVLNNNIDLGGYAINRTGKYYTYSNFDGQGHTVSNFTLEAHDDPDVEMGFSFAGLFGGLDGQVTIKNLIVSNATVKGDAWVGVIAGASYSGKVENCKVYDCTVYGTKKVGTIVGYLGGKSVEDCYAENCNVLYKEKQGGEIIGYIDTESGATVAGNDYKNVTVTGGIDYVLTNAEEFKAYITELNNDPSHGSHRYDGANVALTCDVDLGGAVIEASDEGWMFDGSFNGLNHTVSNYTIRRTDSKKFTGLFSVYMSKGDTERNVFIKNLTVKNGTVISNGAQAAAIVPSVYEGATVDNCHAIDCFVIGEKKVGAVTGLAATGGTVSNCTTSGNALFASDSRAEQVSVFGYENGGTFTGNTDKGGNVLTYDTTVTAVSTAAEFSNLRNTKATNILLLNDLNMAEIDYTPLSYVSDVYNPLYTGKVVIDGNGYSISGLPCALLADNFCSDLTVKNLTIKNSTVATTNGNGCGALADYMNECDVTLENCHLDNVVTVFTSRLQQGGFIGLFSSGNLSVNGCTVKNSIIDAGSSAGAIVGHCQMAAGKTVKIEKCTVMNCAFKSNDQGDDYGTAAWVPASWRIGAIVGTFNGSLSGSLTLDACTESGNTYTMVHTNATISQPAHTLYGRDVRE